MHLKLREAGSLISVGLYVHGWDFKRFGDACMRFGRDVNRLGLHAIKGSWGITCNKYARCLKRRACMSFEGE